MAADGLVMYGAQALAAMVLVLTSWNIPVSAPECINSLVPGIFEENFS